MERLTFNAVREAVLSRLQAAGIVLTDELFGQLLKFLSGMCTYEEEERRIKPVILVGCNLEQLYLQNDVFVPVATDDLKGSKFGSTMKALTPFCCNGWVVFINIEADQVVYGILRVFSGLTGLTLTEMLFSDDAPEPGVMLFRALNRHELSMHASGSEECIVDVGFLPQETAGQEGTNARLAKACVSAIEDDVERAVVRRVLEVVLRLTADRVHGTICVVVKNEDTLPTDLFVDGKYLEPPIDLRALALDAADPNARIVAIEKFYAVSGLLLEMMNVDGACLIDTECRIRAFNAFAKVQDGAGLTGGARRRAANALLQSKHPLVCGVYFQSQDGHSWFEEMTL